MTDIQVAVSEREALHLQLAAEAAGMDVSDYVVLLTDIADGLPRPIVDLLRLPPDDPSRVAFLKSIMEKPPAV
ncbi:hypothetical protein ASF70_13025 [Rhizobium sp. Leaf321]|uniref:hypothetical protein n=1 Tax=Rhizobium sp. Leaf321 TaxID=1736335 RepID=UPI000714FC9A|nr:hypothetical protein [Rhizobium sp. Leaf321]KQQ72447.1 hypothetical protein ASF70_13025 [Rhizobium sp. Leaf321]